MFWIASFNNGIERSVDLHIFPSPFKQNGNTQFVGGWRRQSGDGSDDQKGKSDLRLQLGIKEDHHDCFRLPFINKSLPLFWSSPSDARIRLQLCESVWSLLEGWQGSPRAHWAKLIIIIIMTTMTTILTVTRPSETLILTRSAPLSTWSARRSSRPRRTRPTSPTPRRSISSRRTWTLTHATGEAA